MGEGVGPSRRRVVGVTGAPGAWLNAVARTLEESDALILWPDQSLELSNAKKLYDLNAENVEVERMNNSVFEACNTTRFSGKIPRFFDAPFPGPREFLSKFPADKLVVVADNTLCLLWDVWSPHITDLIIVTAPPEITTSFLQRWIDGNMTREECSDVYECYRTQLEEVVQFGSARTLHLDNAMVMHDKKATDEKVKGFLNSRI